MTAQNNNNLAISQPGFIGSMGPVLLVSEKEKEKQQEELLKLAAALQAVESDLAESKAAAKEGKVVQLKSAKGADDDSNGPSSKAFADAMAAMVLALQQLQIDITEFSQKKASYDAGISQEQVALAQHNLQQAIQALQKVQSEGFWEKFAEAFVAAFSAIAAVITCNPELLIITAISILAMTGVMSKITQGISDVLQDMGVPKDAADVIAAAVVVIIVMVATLGMGEAAAAETVAEEATTEVAADSSSFISKVKNLLQKINVFNKLSPRANLMIVSAVQSISSTGLITDLAELIMAHTNVSKKERQLVEQILSYIVAAIAIIVSIGASTGMATSSSASNTVADMDAKFLKFSRAFFRIAGFGQAAGGLTEGGLNISKGILQKDLAIINANMILIRTAMEMDNTQTTEDQKHQAAELKQQSVGNRSIMDLAKGEEGFANLFTRHSPV